MSINIDKYVLLANVNFCCNVKKNDRRKNNVWGRFAVFVAMYKDGYTLKRIGLEFGLTHASIIHGINTHNNLYNSDKLYTQKYNAFKELAQHESITPKERLIKLIDNIPSNLDVYDAITKYIINKHF